MTLNRLLKTQEFRTKLKKKVKKKVKKILKKINERFEEKYIEVRIAEQDRIVTEKDYGEEE